MKLVGAFYGPTSSFLCSLNELCRGKQTRVWKRLHFSNDITVWLHCQYGAHWLLNCHRMVVATATASSSNLWLLLQQSTVLAYLYIRTSESDWSIKQNTCLSFCIRLHVIFLYSPSKFVTTSHAYKDPGQAVCICSREHAAVLRSPCHSVCKHGRTCCLHLTNYKKRTTAGSDQIQANTELINSSDC